MGYLSHPGLCSFHLVRMFQIRVHDSDCELTLVGWLELKIKQVSLMTGLRSNLDLKSEIWETEAGGSKVAKIQDLPQLQYCEFKRARAGLRGEGSGGRAICAPCGLLWKSLYLNTSNSCEPYISIGIHGSIFSADSFEISPIHHPRGS